MSPAQDIPVALTIATSDSGAGAGIQADLLTFAARKVYGTTVQVALTAQNPDGVSAIKELDDAFIIAQLDQLFGYYPIKAVKTGMLFNARIIRLVAHYLAQHAEVPLVVDPVMVATSGATLLQKEAIETLKTKLLPRATLITPNLDEAVILGIEKPDGTETMTAAALQLQQTYQTAILLKGGHLEGDGQIVDILATDEGARTFRHPRIHDVNTHGSGCTLSAAITAELAKDQPLHIAVRNALEYLDRGLRRPLHVAADRFIAH